MGDVHYFSDYSKTLHEGESKLSPNGFQMIQDARALASQFDAASGVAGYVMLALENDGSWRTCFMVPTGTILTKTMFAAFAKEVITRDMSTADEVKLQRDEG